VAYRETNVTRAALPRQNRVEYFLQCLILIEINALEAYLNFYGDYSDSDTSSESECESNQESSPGLDYDTEESYENLELELSEMIHDEYENALWNPEAQL
jgi:hypothetical protein